MVSESTRRSYLTEIGHLTEYLDGRPLTDNSLASYIKASFGVGRRSINMARFLVSALRYQARTTGKPAPDGPITQRAIDLLNQQVQAKDDPPSIKESTRIQHQRYLRTLEDYLRGQPLTDTSLAEFLSVLYERGKSLSMAGQVVSAVRRRAVTKSEKSPVGPATHRVMAKFRMDVRTKTNRRAEIRTPNVPNNFDQELADLRDRMRSFEIEIRDRLAKIEGALDVLIRTTRNPS